MTENAVKTNKQNGDKKMMVRMVRQKEMSKSLML